MRFLEEMWEVLGYYRYVWDCSSWLLCNLQDRPSCCCGACKEIKWWFLQALKAMRNEYCSLLQCLLYDPYLIVWWRKIFHGIVGNFLSHWKYYNDDGLAQSWMFGLWSTEGNNISLRDCPFWPFQMMMIYKEIIGLLLHSFSFHIKCVWWEWVSDKLLPSVDRELTSWSYAIDIFSLHNRAVLPF